MAASSKAHLLCRAAVRCATLYEKVQLRAPDLALRAYETLYSLPPVAREKNSELEVRERADL